MAEDRRRTVRSWKLYDWANSAFSTVIMAAVFPEFYGAIAGSMLDRQTATSYWGYCNTIALLVVALAAPVMGSIADYCGARKRFLGGFAFVGILATALMIGIGNGMWFYASLAYVLGRVGFGCANVFYDGLLPHIARQEEIDRVSAEGYACGYLGGGILLAINLLMILKPEFFCIPDAEWGSRIAFLTVAIWWAVFSIPILRDVPEPPGVASGDEGYNPIVAAYRRLRRTFKDIRRFRELITFLLAFWLYNDGIGTIIIMAVIYGAEIGIGRSHLIGAILMVQFTGIPFTMLFGRLPQRVGTQNSVLLALGIYTVIAVLGYFIRSPGHFWLLAFLVSVVQGGTQSLSRSMYGSMTPLAKSAEFFGFYSVSAKFAGILGPTLFAVVGQVTGSSRFGIISIMVFFLAGAAVLTRVNQRAGIEAAMMVEQP